MEIPEHFYPPAILDAAGPYFDAFWALCSDRPIGFGVARIPFSAVDRYATRYGFDDRDEFDLFYRLVRVMDDEFMAEIKKRKPSKDG